MPALLQGEGLASRDVMPSIPLLLLHDSKIMQPLIKPTVRRHLRTYKADGVLYRTFQSFIQSTNTIRGSRPVCNPDWHAVQTWSSWRWASASNCPQPGCQRQPGSLTSFSRESQTKNLHFATVTFLVAIDLSQQKYLNKN